MSDLNSKMKNFSNKSDFHKFLTDNPESGELIKGMEHNIPYNFPIKGFLQMEWLALSFESYRDQIINVKFSPKTGEIFIADMNNGGHAAQCRILKPYRDTFFTYPGEMISWTTNRAYKLWQADAKNIDNN